MPYGNKNTTVLETPVTSQALTASGNTGALPSYGYATTLRAQLNVTAASGTTPTLDVVIEDTLDGANWNTIGTFTQLTAAGRQVINITTPFSDTIRVRWTVGGTTPSFTSSVTWVTDRPGV
jgi:hypothetical protein